MRHVLLVVWAALLCSGGAFAQSFDYSPGFTAGAPEEMAALEMDEGHWSVALEYPAGMEDGEVIWAPWATTSATLHRAVEGAGLVEHNDGFPIAGNGVGTDGKTSWAFMTIYGFDRFAGVYRAMVLDNVLGLPDLYEAAATERGLSFSNLLTPTANNLGPDATMQKSRFDLEDITSDRFVVTWWTLDEGNIQPGEGVADQPWQPSVRMTYTRDMD